MQNYTPFTGNYHQRACLPPAISERVALAIRAGLAPQKERILLKHPKAYTHQQERQSGFCFPHYANIPHHVRISLRADPRST